MWDDLTHFRWPSPSNAYQAYPPGRYCRALLQDWLNMSNMLGLLGFLRHHCLTHATRRRWANWNSQNSASCTRTARSLRPERLHGRPCLSGCLCRSMHAAASPQLTRWHRMCILTGLELICCCSDRANVWVQVCSGPSHLPFGQFIRDGGGG